MSGQKKGFDPLSRLFDNPPPEERVPLPPVPNETPVDPADLDAPSPKAPPLTMPAPSLSSKEEELSFNDSGSFERPTAAPLPPPEPPAAKAAPAVDPVELAKMLAKAAAARAASNNPKEFSPPAGRLSQVPPPAAPKAPAPRPAPVENYGDYSDPIPEPEPPPPPPPPVPGSRLKAAPPPPTRQKSAAEVLEELARQPAAPPVPERRRETPRAEAPRVEAPRPEVPVKPREGDLKPLLEVLLKNSLGNAAGLRIAGYQVVEDRDVQKALWKGHRARFLATGDVEHGLAASAVVNVLGRTPSGALAVVRLVSGDRDWLVWVDTSVASCIASFPNAGLWFTGL